MTLRFNVLNIILLLYYRLNSILTKKDYSFIILKTKYLQKSKNEQY